MEQEIEQINEDETAVAARPTKSNFPFASISCKTPSYSMSPHSQTMFSEGLLSNSTQESRTDSASNWYEKFAENIL